MFIQRSMTMIFALCIAVCTGVSKTYYDVMSMTQYSPVKYYGYTINVYSSSKSIRTGNQTWDVYSIELKSDVTIVTKVVTTSANNSCIYAVHNEFIEDSDTGQRYYILSSQVGFEKNSTYLPKKGTYYIKEYYPALPIRVKRINVHSGSRYHLKDVVRGYVYAN